MGVIPTETADLIRENAQRIFVEGNPDGRPIFEQIGEVLKERPFHESHAVRVAMEALYRTLPHTTKQQLHEGYFKEIPIAIPRINGFRVLPKIGEGYANKVYLLNTKGENSDERSYTVGLSIKNFSNQDEAFEHAKERKGDYDRVKSLFEQIPDFIPQERYLVFNNLGKPAVMFVRDFVPGSLTDIFTDYTEEELLSLLRTNSTLKATFEQFSQICNARNDFVLDQHLDILGTNNLAIAGDKGHERLILLDPHTIEKDENGTLEPSYRERIERRIDYVNKILKEL